MLTLAEYVRGWHTLAFLLGMPFLMGIKCNGCSDPLVCLDCRREPLGEARDELPDAEHAEQRPAADDQPLVGQIEPVQVETPSINAIGCSRCRHCVSRCLCSDRRRRCETRAAERVTLCSRCDESSVPHR